MSKFLDFIKGDIPKALIIQKLLPLTLGILGITTLLSNLVFPTAYDWRYMVISALTNAEDNPHGFWILSVGMTICGFLMIPFPGYLQKRFKMICRGTAAIGTFFFTLGIIGLILVGLLYEGMGLPNRTHENLAVVAFLGLVFGIFFYGFPMMKDSIPKYGGHQQFDKKWMIFGFAIMWFAVLGMGISAAYLELVENDWGWVGIEWIELGAPVLASFALWEWTLFICLLTYLVILFKITPDQIIPLQNK